MALRSLLIFAAGLVAFAQAPPPSTVIPSVVLSAMHCIKSGNPEWLMPFLMDEQGTLKFGFKWDRTSWPGMSHLFVAIFESRSVGQIFDLLDEPRNENVQLTLVNQRRFSVDGMGVKYKDDRGVPGEVLDRTVKQLVAAPRFSVSVDRIMTCPPKSLPVIIWKAP